MRAKEKMRNFKTTTIKNRKKKTEISSIQNTSLHKLNQLYKFNQIYKPVIVQQKENKVHTTTMLRNITM